MERGRDGFVIDAKSHRTHVRYDTLGRIVTRATTGAFLDAVC